MAIGGSIGICLCTGVATSCFVLGITSEAVSAFGGAAEWLLVRISAGCKDLKVADGPAVTHVCQ